MGIAKRIKEVTMLEKFVDGFVGKSVRMMLSGFHWYIPEPDDEYLRWFKPRNNDLS